MRGRWLLSAGWRLQCPLCGFQLRTWSLGPSGDRWLCPRCQSMPRHRLLWLHLERERLLEGLGAVLHLAPEPAVAAKLQPAARHYVSADLEPGRAMLAADLTALPFDDAAFDLVVCSHVLEHVPDDRAAMNEIRRVLAPGGIAIIQTPVNYEQAGTYEDSGVTDPEERLARFSQPDHVRVYGRDLQERLRSAGFAVSVSDAADWPARDVERFGLFPRWGPLRNEVFSARRAAPAAR